MLLHFYYNKTMIHFHKEKAYVHIQILAYI